MESANREREGVRRERRERSVKWWWLMKSGGMSCPTHHRQHWRPSVAEGEPRASGGKGVSQPSAQVSEISRVEVIRVGEVIDDSCVLSCRCARGEKPSQVAARVGLLLVVAVLGWGASWDEAYSSIKVIISAGDRSPLHVPDSS